MSRIGRKPVEIPKGVEVVIEGNEVTVKGRLGTLTRRFTGVRVKKDGARLLVGPDESHPNSRALWGLSRTLLNNMVVGVSQGFSKRLAINGVGYRAELKGNSVLLHVGYSRPVECSLPEGVTATVEEKNTRIVIAGADKEVVGNVAATIRAVRPVEPYKGKGIHYVGEKVRRKVGKTGAR